MRTITRIVTPLFARLGVAIWLLAGTGLRAESAERWAVCYSDGPSAFDLVEYDVVVLDPDRHPPLAPLVDRDRTVLAYLSLTQIGAGRHAYSVLDEAGVILEAHPVWTDARYVDFRRAEWTKAIIEEFVPRALASGFTGLFLDTLDDAEFLETQDPARYGGMRQAAIQLVRAIRHHYPDIVLMVNRGYGVVPAVADSIDILLGESVRSTFDPVTKSYAAVPASDVLWQVNALRRAKALNPRLKLFTLDYWDPADSAGVRRLYREQRADGFVPYVATPLLDTVVEEPR